MEEHIDYTDNSPRETARRTGAAASRLGMASPPRNSRREFKGGSVSANEATRLRVITGGPMAAPGVSISGDGLTPRTRYLDDRTQRGLRTLAAGIAHHYNNLNMGIQGYLTLIRSRDTRFSKTAGRRLSEIQQLVRYGSCFPVHFLEYLKNDLYDDQFRSILAQIVYFYPANRISNASHQLATERRIFFTRLNTARDSSFIPVLVGGICKNYERMFKRMQKLLALLAKDLTTSAASRHAYFGMWRLIVRSLNTTRRLAIYAAEPPKATRLVSVHNEMAACCQEFERKHQTARIHRKFYPDEVQVRANPEQLRDIIHSVLENAIDAMPDGGPIQVETRLVRPHPTTFPNSPEAGKFLAIEVQDSGEGIAEALLDRIFDPFFTTKSGTEHQGLGLTSVYGQVHAMCGTIRVESEPGRGTCLTICLPAWSVVRHEVQPMVLPDGISRDIPSEIVTLV